MKRAIYFGSPSSFFEVRFFSISFSFIFAVSFLKFDNRIWFPEYLEIIEVINPLELRDSGERFTAHNKIKSVRAFLGKFLVLFLDDLAESTENLLYAFPGLIQLNDDGTLGTGSGVECVHLDGSLITLRGHRLPELLLLLGRLYILLAVKDDRLRVPVLLEVVFLEVLEVRLFLAL